VSGGGMTDGQGSGPAGAAAAVAAAAAPRGLRRYQWLATLGAAAGTRRGVAGLILTGIVVLTAVIGPFVARYSPTAFVTTDFSPPTGRFLLGADDLGRDVLSRVLDGGWVLLLMAVAATAFGIIVGGAAGISAAYLRGRTDGLIMRTVDVILAFPQLVFALLLVSIIGPKLWLIVIAVGFSHAPAVARVLRSATLDVSERDFVKSVELQGVRPARIMMREILPNVVSPLMVEIGLRLTYSIVVMAGLSFLGFGQQPPAPNWGTMINENRIALTVNPWGVIVPAALIAVLTIGTNTFTDAIARVAIGVERPPEEAALVDEIGLREAVTQP
jgi:peptide/nickel transport system permease protein